MPTKKIQISDIVRDPRTQMREKELDPAVVNEYALAMENGDEFPDITVFSEDGKSAPYYLGDGWYRTAAHEKSTPLLPIQANVRKGGLREAILFAVGANSAHGLRRTNADKRKAVKALLADDEWTGWADTVIAKRANVSQPFVSTLRRDFEKLVDEDKSSSQNVLSAAPAKRIGSDGVSRTVRKAKPKERKKTRRHPCRVCGCTDSKPCPGGCSWVEDDLCSVCAEKLNTPITDKRRVTEKTGTDAGGPQPGMVALLGSKKEKPIAELLDGKALVIMFQFLPKVPGVSVVVHRNDPPTASRVFMKTEDMPRMPEAVLNLIAKQLEGKS
jgi:hypothetical protein